MVTHLKNILVAVAACLMCVACDDYNDFTTDRTATLSFSADTIRFDTLITTIPSATQTLIVYNRTDKGLRISEVSLEGGATSPFRVNVDGQDLSRTAQGRATDFEVRRRDSIFIRTEVTVPASGSDAPFQVTDAIVLTLESGIRHRIPLVAGGQDAFFLRGIVLRRDTTFTANRPNVIYDSLVVQKGCTLTIPAGSQLLFHEGAYLRASGSIVATGTLNEPVIFRGDRTDHMFDYLPYDRLPARWEGIEIDAESTGNWLEYADIHSAKYGIRCHGQAETISGFNSEDTIQSPQLLIVNSRISNIGGPGIEATNALMEVRNSEVSNTLGNCVSITGGASVFTHCTLAQFYPLDAMRGSALFLTDSTEAGYQPIRLCDFNNCVITGYAADELMGTLASTSPSPANYHFRNCYIATVETDDPQRFIGIVYDAYDRETHPLTGAGNFLLLDTHNFIYDFTPTDSSLICGMADPLLSRRMPADRLGRSRFSDGAPDAGCYECPESRAPTSAQNVAVRKVGPKVR